MADTGRPVVFQPGATCPTGYLCITGMAPIKLPDIVDFLPDELGPTPPPEPSQPPMGQPGGEFLPSWPQPDSMVEGPNRGWLYPVWPDGLTPTDPGYIMYPFPTEGS